MYRQPAEIPRARLPLLDQVTVKTPCREPWAEMEGNDRVRFCTRCSKNVHDLSAMTQDEAESFLATHLDEENPCIRLYRRPDGRILTSECSTGARVRHARKVVGGVTAGLCAAFAGTLALANVHVPDGMNLPRPRARIDVKRLSVRSTDVVGPEVALGDLVGTRHDDVTGFSMGHGYVSGSASARKVPTVRELRATASPGVPIPVVSAVVRQSFGRVRLCYESSLRRNPALTGAVSVDFVIDRDGSVLSAQDGGSDLPDQATVSCIVRGFQNLSFPPPDPTAGRVRVSYRVSLQPGS
jgi:hypothetical protein